MLNEEKMMGKLNSASVESLVYIGYYLPKSQAELERYVYKSPTNISPLSNARKRLMELKWVYPVHTTAMKNIPLKSASTPFIKYLKLLSDKRKSIKGNEHKLTKDDLRYVEMFLDSDFFRETFFNKDFFDEGIGIHRSVIHRDDDNGKVVVESAIRYMSLILEGVALQSWCLYPEFKVHYVKNIADIINKYSSFNNFLEEHISHVKESGLGESIIKEDEKIKFALEYVGRDKQLLYYFDKVVFKGVFLVLPYELADRLLAVIQSGALRTFERAYYDYVVRETPGNKLLEDKRRADVL